MSSISYPNGRLHDDGLRKMQLDRFEVFKAQDLEDGHFDITFDIQGKKLHANKFILTPVSETMKVMLSTRWSNKDEVVKIESYSYDDFYQFLCFLYSGECYISNENVFQLVDMAEFYGVSFLKEVCDKHLSQKNFYCAVENIEEMFEFTQKYSMAKMLSVVTDYISHNFIAILNACKFMSSKKPFIQHLTCCCTNVGKFHEALFKWSEHQILQRQTTDDDGNVNLQEAIEAEFTSVVSKPEFSKMSFDFLMDFIVEKGFVLSPIDFQYLRFQHLSNKNDEKSVFERSFKLAEKQALQKQKKASAEDNFNVSDSIKADLAGVTPKFGFYHLDEQFLMNSVVQHGIITEEQANRVYDIRVCVRNDGKHIYGVFKDEIGLQRAYAHRKYSFAVKRRSTTNVRFPEKRFTIPQTPSTVTKMKGVDWYLCLEQDGIISFKTYSEVSSSDYLLAEMKSDTEYQLTRAKKTVLSAEYINLTVGN